MIEIEAKFSINDVGLLEKYRDCDYIGRYHLGTSEELFVVDDYLDTREGTILNAGYHLRVRTCGGNQIVTIKSSQSQESRFSVREEIEFPLHREASDVDSWVNQEAVALINPLLQGRDLCVNVQLRQRRSERQVCDGTDVLAMMSLDGVQVWHSGLILDDFHVLEFELLSGIDMIVLEDISSVLAKDGLEAQPVAKLSRALMALQMARKETRNVA